MIGVASEAVVSSVSIIGEGMADSVVVISRGWVLLSMSGSGLLSMGEEGVGRGRGM